MGHQCTEGHPTGHFIYHRGIHPPPSPPVQTEMIIYMVRRITPGFTPVDLMEKCIQIGR